MKGTQVASKMAAVFKMAANLSIHCAITHVHTYAKYQLQRSNRMEFIWDEYKAQSLKAATRQGRGKGIRTWVTGNTHCPRNGRNI